MISLTEALVGLQAFGAVIGVVATVFGEIAYLRVRKSTIVSTAESAHLKHIARGLRFGMSILLLASLGLVVLAYSEHWQPQPALQSAYWTQIATALLIIGLSWALSKRRISFALGSAGIFSGWWFLALLALGQIPKISFGAAVALYVVCTGILFALLWYTRILALPKN